MVDVGMIRFDLSKFEFEVDIIVECSHKSCMINNWLVGWVGHFIFGIFFKADQY